MIILVISGGAVAVLAAMLVVWALFGDRSRARRCRKCWYHMEGVPGLRCPECGWEAKHESTLTRRRRRRWWATIGVVFGVVGAGAALHAESTRRTGGWWAFAPNSVLVWVYANAYDANAEMALSKRDIDRMSRGQKRAIFLAAFERARNPQTTFTNAQVAAIMMRMFSGISAEAVATSDPALAARCVKELLASDDPEIHRDVLEMFIKATVTENLDANTLNNDAWRLQSLALGYPIETYTRLYANYDGIPRDLFDVETADLVADRLLEDGAVSLHWSLVFFAEVTPFDAQRYAMLSEAAIARKGTFAASASSAILMHLGADGRYALADALQSPTPMRRYFALLAIGELGPDATDLAGAAFDAAADDDPRIAGAAQWAIRRIMRTNGESDAPPTWESP